MEARQLRCEHRFRYVSRGVSLVVAFLLCLGVFLLPLPATGSEVPSALAVANLPRFDLEANGNDHPLDESYLVAPALVLRGAKERLAPILMTASATGLALVPLAVAGSVAVMRSSTQWRSSFWAGWSPRRCLTCSSCPPCTSASGDRTDL